MTPRPALAMVAGEASGDLLAGLLLDGLRARWPGLAAGGIGGARMVAAGFQAWWPCDKLAVRGYFEVLRHYREIVGIRKRLKARLLADRPDLFIGVDAPDFNLALEADLKLAGVKTVHFVCPSIWAWRAGRIDQIRRSADHVLCIFPFEPELLARHGIAATYVGHPLAEAIPVVPDRMAARDAIGLARDDLVLAVLPGSRISEIRYMARRFLEAARLLKERRSQLRLLLPALPALRQRIAEAAQGAGLAGTLEIVDGRSHTVLAACDAALVASGTATLEAALFKRPMVIGYAMHPLSWHIMRRQRLQPWVGLPNILSREFVVPELLQESATPAALADALLPWLDARQADPGRILALQQRFTALHFELLRDTPKLAADAIEKIIAR